MSIDYTIKLAVGYIIPEEELTRAFGKVTPPKTHMEDRFDPKSGKKLAPEEVVDHHGYTTITYKGKVVEDGENQLAEDIAKDLDCGLWLHGSSMSGEMSYVFGPNLEKLYKPYDSNELNEGHLTAEGIVPFALLTECGSALGTIRKALKELGLNPGEPMVLLAGWIS
jgi:hypothetical protein